MISLKATLEAIKSKISSHETSIANKQDKTWTLLGVCNGSTTCTLSSALNNYNEVNILCIDGSNGSSYGWSVCVTSSVAALRSFLSYCRSDSNPHFWVGQDGGVRAIISINRTFTQVTVSELKLWGVTQSSYTGFVYAR